MVGKAVEVTGAEVLSEQFGPLPGPEHCLDLLGSFGALGDGESGSEHGAHGVDYGGCPYVPSQAARAAGSGDGAVVGGW